MRYLAQLAIRICFVCAVLFVASPASAVLDQDAPAFAASELLRRLDAIHSDLERFQQQILAANTASNPATRAAAIEQASGTLARLVAECKEVEQLYAGLKSKVPPKTGSSAATATAELEAIVTDLEASANDLEKARTELASLH